MALWEWIIDTSDTKTIYIDMSRNKNNYEDIVIKYVPYTGQEANDPNSTFYSPGIYYPRANEVTLTSKNMTDWEGGIFNLNLSDTPITQLIVRAEAFNDSSNYEILIEQEGIDYGYPSAFTKNKTLVEYVALGLLISFIVLILGLFAFAVCRRTKKFRLKQAKKYKSVTSKANKITRSVMENMAYGKYGAMPESAQARDWKVWNEGYFNDSDVHLTNECQHMFHSECLESWYTIIGKSNTLYCPICETHNRPYNPKHKGDIDLDEGNIGKTIKDNFNLEFSDDGSVFQPNRINETPW